MVKEVLPGVAAALICIAVLLIVLLNPVRSEHEIEERAAAKAKRKKRSIDTLGTATKIKRRQT